MPAHFWHILMALAVIIVPAIVIVAFVRHDRAVMARRAAGVEEPDPAQARVRPLRATMALAAASAGAGLVHALVCPEHFKEATSYGLFFLAAASAQVAWAWLAWRGLTRPLLQWAVAGNGAVLVLWAVTRTVGLPFGPDPGAAESVGGADLVACAFELYIVVAGWLALSRNANGAPLVAAPRSNASA